MSEAWDVKGLIRESFRIDGIGLRECRSIFLDWSISLGADVAVHEAIAGLLEVYQDHEGHPMIEVLQEGLAEPAARGRRGGYRSRR